MIVSMENTKTLKEEIVEAVREVVDPLPGRLDVFSGRIDGLSDNVAAIRGSVDSLRGGVQSFKAEVNNRFDSVDKEISKQGVLMEAMDDKFTLITEGQDILRDILETRVARIEENLGIESRI